MNYWLIPAKKKMYNHTEAFDELGIIDWRYSNRNFKLGDIVYIYTTKPTSKIEIKCCVTKTKIPFDEKINDDINWNPKYLEQSSGKTFVRLKLLKKFDTDKLSYDKLNINGLKRAPQGPMYLKGNLLQYVSSIDSDYSADYKSEAFFEGNQTKILTNQYERNPKARQACLDFYGYDCQVCGINFRQKYGTIGKDFIHVHHIIPIYKRTKEYKVDPIKDLIPVCPNCHAMLHQKSDINDYYSTDELREIINNIQK